jgi:4-diphosphocytidyl-2-C-methyl-D-erythritol kinase
VKAHAKLNLALVVGPLRSDGKHEVVTVYQRLELADELHFAQIDGETRIDGFDEDTLIRPALAAADPSRHWHVRVAKHIPVAAGLGGGSSDAATALRHANRDRTAYELEQLAAQLGADVPFFLREGPQLGTGDGSTLHPVDLPQDYHVVLFLPDGATKSSTADVYRAFDERQGSRGWENRRARLLAALQQADVADFPPNDLASSPHARELRSLGAFRADVTGAGPTVYGLFADAQAAQDAGRELERLGRVWITAPAW